MRELITACWSVSDQISFRTDSQLTLSERGSWPETVSPPMPPCLVCTACSPPSPTGGHEPILNRRTARPLILRWTCCTSQCRSSLDQYSMTAHAWQTIFSQILVWFVLGSISSRDKFSLTNIAFLSARAIQNVNVTAQKNCTKLH